MRAHLQRQHPAHAAAAGGALWPPALWPAQRGRLRGGGSSSSSTACCCTSSPRASTTQTLLASPFPNSLLLPGAQLPPLRGSRHFVNLTNGLELLPLLHELQLPYSVVRIRSTCLEQQLFESLMLELDANLLLALALGHSCIVWDCGCRNRTNGAPRALWYGLELIRWVLSRFWFDAGAGQHSSASALLRGHDVSADWERACSHFHPSTKKRLRYYRRYTDSTPGLAARGLRLAGLFTRTDNDEDVGFYTSQAAAFCGPSAATCASSSSAAAVALDDASAYELLAARGVGMFVSGLSHAQFAQLRQAGLLDGGEQKRRND